MSVLVFPTNNEWDVLQRLKIGDGDGGIVLVVPPDVQEWMERETALKAKKNGAINRIDLTVGESLAAQGSRSVDYSTHDAELWIDIAYGAGAQSAMKAIRDLFGLSQPAAVCSVNDAAAMLHADAVIVEDNVPAEIRYNGWLVRTIERVDDWNYGLVLDGAAPVQTHSADWVELFPIAPR